MIVQILDIYHQLMDLDHYVHIFRLDRVCDHMEVLAFILHEESACTFSR